MKLSTRLILLIFFCLVPILVAQIYAQRKLLVERRQQISALALRQAELANNDITSILDGVRQFSIMANRIPAVRASADACGPELDKLLGQITRYRFIAILDAQTHRPVCSVGLSRTTHLDGAWLDDLRHPGAIVVGGVTAVSDRQAGLLSIGVMPPAAPGDDDDRIFVIGLRLAWLAGHLKAARSDETISIKGAQLYVTDREGRVLGQIGSDTMPPEANVPAWLRPVINLPGQGVQIVTAADGASYIAAFVPSRVEPLGVATIEVLPLPSAMADINAAAAQDLLITIAAAVAALLLAWFAGRRFIFEPTQALMQAARRWREGDFTARAHLSESGSEFSALAQSFNAMAAGLEAREQERAAQASFLEAQVAERTRALSESNNRLQVEIAGREKTEAALHQAQKLQAVGQLAGGIAHDFNNMLATVLGNLELMERRLIQAGPGWSAADKDRLLQLIERATGAVQRGGQLTSRLLAFSRRQRLAARPTDINALLRELITLAASTLGRRIEVVADLTADLWPAQVDPSQVEAAILNLCLNARDAMPDGGRLTIATANLHCDPSVPADECPSDLTPGDYICITVRDTGAGMTAEVKARAFEPFFTTKGPGAGSGLGLSQVYGMARQLDGAVTIDSTPNQGTAVRLLLPRAQEAIQPPATGALAPAHTTGTSAETVLIIDDDQAVRQVAVEMVRDLGFHVLEAASGDAALAILQTLPEPPRFILVDYAMPGMNGLQFVRHIRAKNNATPIALVTGYAELSHVDLAAEGLDSLLYKPFTIQELAALCQALRASAPHRLERV